MQAFFVQDDRYLLWDRWTGDRFTPESVTLDELESLIEQHLTLHARAGVEAQEPKGGRLYPVAPALQAELARRDALLAAE